LTRSVAEKTRGLRFRFRLSDVSVLGIERHTAKSTEYLKGLADLITGAG
jgi:hypothetical protein